MCYYGNGILGEGKVRLGLDPWILLLFNPDAFLGGLILIWNPFLKGGFIFVDPRANVSWPPWGIALILLSLLDTLVLKLYKPQHVDAKLMF